MRRLLPCLSESLLRNGITMEVMNVDEFGLPRQQEKCRLRLTKKTKEIFMTKYHNIAKTAALALALGAALPALARADDVVVDSNGTHHYVFYKDHDIYFAPDTKVYYWNENGQWRSANVLPAEQQRYVSSGGVDISLDTTTPYERNDYVLAHYKDMPSTTRETATRTNSDGSTTTTTTTTTQHNYVYYGGHDIYFAPETKVYYWKTADGSWTSGTVLPDDRATYVRNGGVTIQLDTDKPYERNDY